MGRVVLGLVVLAAIAAAWWFLRPAAAPAPLPPAAPAAPAPPPAQAIDEAAPAAPTADAAPDSAPAATPPAPPAVGGLAVVGRVVDTKRFPVASAVVTLPVPGAGALRATSDAEGRFRIEGVPRPGAAAAWAGAVLARAPDGRAGLGQVWFTSERADPLRVEPIVVDAVLPLSVRVVRDGAPVPGARVHLGGGVTWVLDAAAGPDGVARFDAAPKGAWHLLARAEDFSLAGRAECLLAPELAQPVEVAVKETGTVEVKAVVKGSADPVPGATFRVVVVQRSPGYIWSGDPGPMPPIAPTDAEGRTRVAGVLPDDSLVLENPRAPGFFPAGFQRSGTRVQPGQQEATIEMAGARELRFPVEDGEVPPPADGARIALEPVAGSGGAPPEGDAFMEGTTLVVPRATAHYFSAIAAAPDGARARLWADDKGTAPKPVQFRPARTVEVIAKRPDGSPAEGAIFQLRNQGNNPIGEPFRSGADGVARATGLSGELAEVCLQPGDAPSMRFGGRPIGSVDLTKGDARIETVVPSARLFVLRVTVDGKPGLPGRFHAIVHGAMVQDLVEDPARGEVRGAVPVEAEVKTVQASLNAPPWLPAQATADAGDGTGPLHFDLALEAGGSLHVPVVLPADKRCRLNLQSNDPERGWTHAQVAGSFVMGSLAPGPDGILRVEPLKPGRYRLVETMTGVATEAAEVRTGEIATLPPFDLSKQRYARGKVIAPEGTTMRDVRILVEGAGVETPAIGPMDSQVPRAQADGTFMVRLPGDRPVTIRPSHPTLVPAAEGGTAEVVESRDDLVLRLEAGRTARVRFAVAPGPAGSFVAGPRVLLFRGEPVGAPASVHAAILEGDTVLFGNYPPGKWTIWIDAGTTAPPTVVRDAELGESGAEIGPVASPEGSRVRVKILVKDGQAVPRIAVTAWREDEPRYTRWMNSNGEAEAVLGGLGAGRFRIQTMLNTGGGAPGGKGMLQETRELDGVNDIELTLDLR